MSEETEDFDWLMQPIPEDFLIDPQIPVDKIMAYCELQRELLVTALKRSMSEKSRARYEGRLSAYNDLEEYFVNWVSERATP